LRTKLRGVPSRVNFKEKFCCRFAADAATRNKGLNFELQFATTGDTGSVAITANDRSRAEIRRAGSMSEQRKIVLIDEAEEKTKTFLQKLLDRVETVGNKVPHPAVIFFILSGLVIVLSHLLSARDIRRLRGRQSADAPGGACDRRRQQPAERRRHPIHADLDGTELHQFRPGRHQSSWS
jgi:hypothetical protein